jgi:hypothetical protein
MRRVVGLLTRATTRHIHDYRETHVFKLEREHAVLFLAYGAYTVTHSSLLLVVAYASVALVHAKSTVTKK